MDKQYLLSPLSCKCCCNSNCNTGSFPSRRKRSIFRRIIGSFLSRFIGSIFNRILHRIFVSGKFNTYFLIFKFKFILTILITRIFIILKFK